MQVISEPLLILNEQCQSTAKSSVKRNHRNHEKVTHSPCPFLIHHRTRHEKDKTSPEHLLTRLERFNSRQKVTKITRRLSQSSLNSTVDNLLAAA